MVDPDGCEGAGFGCFAGPESNVELASSSGCHDRGLSLRYSLAASHEDNWVSIRKEFGPMDLRGHDFMLVPFRGEAGQLPRTLEIKLDDVNGCMSTVLFTAASDLPVFRTLIISLQQFARLGASNCGADMATDLGNIRALEIAVSELGDEVPVPEQAAAGTLHLDDVTLLTADDLRLAFDEFECVERQPDVMARIAGSLRDRQQAHGFIRTWYQSNEIGYNSYAQALALLVFSFEFTRTNDSAFTDAATAVADGMLALQADGSWVTEYVDDGTDALRPLTTERWAGNVAWSLIALRAFIEQVKPTQPRPYESAIRDGANWLKSEIAAFEQQSGLAGGISAGTEGNLSCYFALVAARELDAAEAMASFLIEHAWDAREGRFRMGIDDWGMAIDVVGNWGAEFMRHRGRDRDAKLGLSLAAGAFAVRSWDDEVVGLGDICGPYQPAVEFSSGYVAAGGPGANWLLGQILLLQDRAGAGEFPGAPNDFAAGPGWNTSWHGVSPSAMTYLAMHGGFLWKL